MAPILGIYASQISGHLFAPSGAYDSIATSTVGAGGSSTISFTSIPSTYTHLQIRMIARTNRASTVDAMNLRFNGVSTGSAYAWHDIIGAGTGGGGDPFAEALASQNEIKFYRATAASAASSIFGTVVVDILDYANTNKNKTVRYLGGQDQNGSGEIIFGSGLWNNTSAVNQIDITSFTGNSFVQYSQFALFGIKGS
jgi:hypothetical protein